MKTETLIKTFNKIWTEKEVKENKKPIKKEKFEGYTDSSLVFMIVPKNEQVKELLERFDVTKRAKSDIERFNYKMENFDEAKEEVSCIYSVEYLKTIFELCNDYESVKIKMKRDFPLWVETDDFICMLAPRVEGDEE